MGVIPEVVCGQASRLANWLAAAELQQPEVRVGGPSLVRGPGWAGAVHHRGAVRRDGIILGAAERSERAIRVQALHQIGGRPERKPASVVCANAAAEEVVPLAIQVDVPVPDRQLTNGQIREIPLRGL